MTMETRAASDSGLSAVGEYHHSTPSLSTEDKVARDVLLHRGGVLHLAGEPQELLDVLPDLLSRKKMGRKDLPTEVLIRKKLDFYKEKQKCCDGDPARFVECISVNPADSVLFFFL
ncbi:hypothetical protein B0H17DRAFT_1140775 [Mycena rosella]|uniref:Uncharacterized protein n=1 Tax=Mycena rosella TaxID=1033263 RepID=A0AAD7D178_MYCRO|nr:hypothetical protein B0H17DRAFT_1140775 [Mycena rosella]